VAGERRVFELCDGAGGVSDLGDQGPGWGDGWVCVVVDAYDRSCVWHCDSAGSGGADTDVYKFSDSGGALCLADDHPYGGVAAFS